MSRELCDVAPPMACAKFGMVLVRDGGFANDGVVPPNGRPPVPQPDVPPPVYCERLYIVPDPTPSYQSYRSVIFDSSLEGCEKRVVKRRSCQGRIEETVCRQLDGYVSMSNENNVSLHQR